MLIDQRNWTAARGLLSLPPCSALLLVATTAVLVHLALHRARRT